MSESGRQFPSIHEPEVAASGAESNRDRNMPTVVRAGQVTIAAPISAPPPVANRYVLGEKIAQGGIGVVYRTTDKVLGREVAVKVLQEKHDVGSSVACRFADEARIAAQLQHPAIPPVHDLGTLQDGRPFLAMKLIKGETLAALLDARPNPAHDRGRFVAVFEQVCHALAYAHAHSVIHRDLKPANIMVGSFGEVQVMDWGLAKILGSQERTQPEADPDATTAPTVVRSLRDSDGSDTQAGSVLGTPAFMPPEQAVGAVGKIDARSDVFGLGAILAVILTGEAPFSAGSTETTRVLAAQGQVDECYTRLDQCGAAPELVALCKECLRPRQEERPPDAGAVAKAVAQLRVAAEERARQAELERVQAEIKAKAERKARRLTGALVASVVCLVVAILAGFALLQKKKAEQQARVDLALREAEVLHEDANRAGDDLARWGKARDAAQAAERLLADGQDEESRRRVAALVESVTAEAQAAKNDQELLDKVIEIRSAKADENGSRSTELAYAAAFRDAGLDFSKMPPAEAGAKIKSRPSAVAVALAAALDDWAAVRREGQRDRAGADQLTQAARVADPDPWRNQLRNALELAQKQQRLEALHGLMRSANFDDLPPVSLNLLGSALGDSGDPQAAEKVLRQAQHRYQGDVGLNYNLAQSLEKLGRREEAIRFYTAAGSIRPETAHELAHALQKKGELGEAIAVFQEMARRQPHNGRHFMCLGSVLQEQERVQEAAVAFDKAIAAIRKEIAQKPEDDHLHHILGAALHWQGKLNEAVEEYQEAIRLQPNQGSHHNDLGKTLMRQGKFDQAMEEFRASIRLQADLSGPHHDLGCILCDNKHDYAEAAAEFREAIRLQPDNARSHYCLGIALEHLRKEDEAISEYREAIRFQPAYAKPLFKLAPILRDQGKPDEAIALYKSALLLQPDSALLHNDFGWVLQQQQKINEAISEYREAIRLQPDYNVALVNFARILRGRGKEDEAIAAYSKAIQLQPENERFHNNLAWELALSPKHLQKDYDEALAHARKAVELAPKNGSDFNTLALAEYRCHHWAESIAAAEQSIALRKSGDANDWFFLAMAHWQKGNKDEARKWFDKAVAWTLEKDHKNEELHQFWNEAAELLGMDSGKDLAPEPFKIKEVDSFEEFKKLYMDSFHFYLGNDEEWHYANSVFQDGVLKIRKDKVPKGAWGKMESEKREKLRSGIQPQLPHVKPTKEFLDWYNNAKLSKDYTK
jgi:serine/threonine-protein kinase